MSEGIEKVNIFKGKTIKQISEMTPIQPYVCRQVEGDFDCSLMVVAFISTVPKNIEDVKELTDTFKKSTELISDGFVKVLEVTT